MSAPFHRAHRRLGIKELNVPLRVIVLPEWLKPIVGVFMPDVRELREMRFQTDRAYRVNSDKFARRFWNNPTPFVDGIAATIAMPRECLGEWTAEDATLRF